ncbi:DUF3383 family protein [Acetobacter pasteurianus]|uniref:DUF3383 domain-containing protein n=1 Tax=Acetobacter pasteurianus subsp. pasteurianus TaxID=481145 RepID=A0AAC9SQ46_ACEPA|nr:DUF3383 family protein [Acetobacter pasteurianus]ASC05208.1 hypothetical protein S101468_00941 [Acetobacter pasteurianus subsp. pasteurianus]
MTLSIKNIVNVTPSVVSPAGTVNILKGLVFSTNAALDAGVSSFSTPQAVATKCGADSIEASIASIYFGSYSGSLDTPSTLYFYSLPAAPVDADYGTYLSAAADAEGDWSGFMFAQEPNAAAKTAIAAWMGANPNRYWGVIQDADPNILTANATATFGATVKANSTPGLTCVCNADGNGTLIAAAALSWAASINPNRTNGRTTLMFRRFSGVTPSNISNTQAENLLANGYCFYGSYKANDTSFNWFVDGSVSGSFAWADSYLNQIWMNADFQINLANMFSNVGLIPYDAVGDGIISTSVQATINTALSFGAIQAGVTLSDDEALQVNAKAGKTISTTLQTQGWYLIPGASIASAATRATRGTVDGMFFYMDGESVQSISLASVEVQ